MCETNDARVLKYLSHVFLNLIQHDQNKVKMTSDGGTLFIDTLIKIVKDETLGEFPELLSFLSRGITYLCEDQNHISIVLKNFNIEFLLFLMTKSLDCQQSAARSLLLLSSEEKLVNAFVEAGVFNFLLEFLKFKDVFVKRYAIQTLSNLSKEEKHFKKAFASHHIEAIVELADDSDTEINVYAAEILSNISSDHFIVSKIVSHLPKILEIKKFTQIRYGWESAFLSFVPNLSVSEEKIFDELTPEINYYFNKILANILNISSKKISFFFFPQFFFLNSIFFLFYKKRRKRTIDNYFIKHQCIKILD